MFPARRPGAHASRPRRLWSAPGTAPCRPAPTYWPVDADRHAAHVVAVEAVAGVEKDLVVAERPEHQADLRAGHRRIGRAGIGRRVACHFCREPIMPHTHNGAQPVGQSGGVLRIEPDAVLAHLVAADVRLEDALDGLAQRHIDVVGAALDANLGLAVEDTEKTLEGVAAMEAQDR